MNIAAGWNALTHNQTGSFNIAIGTVLTLGTAINNNVAVGEYAGLNAHGTEMYSLVTMPVIMSPDPISSISQIPVPILPAHLCTGNLIIIFLILM